MNPQFPNLIATGSVDESIKLWDISSARPSLLCSKNLSVASVFALEWCNDDPYLLASAGSAGVLALWNISSEADVLAWLG